MATENYISVEFCDVEIVPGCVYRVEAKYWEENGHRCLRIREHHSWAASPIDKEIVIRRVLQFYGFEGFDLFPRRIEFCNTYVAFLDCWETIFRQKINILYLKFKTDWKPEWQRRKEILMQKFEYGK